MCKLSGKQIIGFLDERLLLLPSLNSVLRLDDLFMFFGVVNDYFS